jgi:hypothetical protein
LSSKVNPAPLADFKDGRIVSFDMLTRKSSSSEMIHSVASRARALLLAGFQIVLHHNTSACGSANGKVKRRRREGGNGAAAERPSRNRRRKARRSFDATRYRS